MNRPLWLVVAAAAGLLTAVPVNAQAATSSTVTIVGPVTTVRPTDTPQGATAANLVAARNEFSSFQIVISAGSGGLQQPAVTLATPLTGAAGTIPADHVSIYGEANYTTTLASKAEGEPTGEWPDALIPTVDQFFGQTRRAFPATVAAGRNAVAWVDVLVPQDAAPGGYDGALRVTAGGLDSTVPVHLTVADFTLPSTSSLAGAFALNWAAPCYAFYGDNCQSHTADGWRVNAMFARAALDNRVTLSTPQYQPPVGADKAEFHTYIAPLLAGTAPTKLPGARLTAIGADLSWLSAWKAEAADDNFTDRVYVQVCDEPSGGGGDPATLWQRCKTNADQAHQGWPGVPVLVTAPIQEADKYGATSKINIMTVELTIMDNKPGEPYAGNQRPAYDNFVATPGNQVWMYLGCNSHGCDHAPHNDPYFNGWAGYTIDQPASEATAMGWLAYVYRTTGELYYETSLHLPTAWTNQYDFGGNGEGTLFYPGTPDRIGGTDPIPVESLRLKRIRDGYQAYEYLKYLSGHGKAADATAVATGLFPHGYDTVRTDAQIQQAHQQLVDLVIGTSSSPGHLSLSTPLAVSTSQPVTASFTVVNDGRSPVTVPYFLAGNRNAANANVDFPASAQVTLAPGQSYTYRQSQTLTAGNYTAWPAYFDGSTWIQLANPSGYTVP